MPPAKGDPPLPALLLLAQLSLELGRRLRRQVAHDGRSAGPVGRDIGGFATKPRLGSLRRPSGRRRLTLALPPVTRLRKKPPWPQLRYGPLRPKAEASTRAAWSPLRERRHPRHFKAARLVRIHEFGPAVSSISDDNGTTGVLEKRCCERAKFRLTLGGELIGPGCGEHERGRWGAVVPAQRSEDGEVGPTATGSVLGAPFPVVAASGRYTHFALAETNRSFDGDLQIGRREVLLMGRQVTQR